MRLEGLAELAQPSSRQVDLLALDLRNTRVIPQTLGSVKRRHPGAGILVFVPGLESALILEAMRAGVNECLAEPVALEDVRNALARIAALRPSPATGAVFGLVGARGGVGATTVAVNLATMLARLPGSRTLLIDLHVGYGDAALFLAAEPRFSVLDALDNSHRLDAAFLRGVVTETKSGVHLLASSDRAIAPPLDAARVRQLIELAASQYTYVIIDAPRTDASVLEALESSAAIVIVANQELSTVRSAGRIAQALQRRYGNERVKVVVTRFDPAADIGRQDVERIVGTPVRHVFPNNYAIALSSLNKGQPLVLENHSKLASSLTRFARSLAGVPEEQIQEKSGRLLGLISGRR